MTLGARKVVFGIDFFVENRLHAAIFSAMNATLNFGLDPEILREAEMEARSRNTTLASIIARQLGIMALNWKASQCGKTPLTDFLRGSVRLPADFDLKATLETELSRKYA